MPTWTHAEVIQAQQDAAVANAHIQGVHGWSAHGTLPGCRLGHKGNAFYDFSMHGMMNNMKQVYKIMTGAGNGKGITRDRIMRIEVAAGRGHKWSNQLHQQRWGRGAMENRTAGEQADAVELLITDRPPWELSPENKTEYNRRFNALILPTGSKTKGNPLKGFGLKCHQWVLLYDEVGKYLLHGLLPRVQQASLFGLWDALYELVISRSVTTSNIPILHRNLVDAIVRLEATWPCIIMTRILHFYLHVGDGVDLLGPTIAWAMWAMESSYGNEVKHLQCYRDDKIAEEMANNVILRIAAAVHGAAAKRLTDIPPLFRPGQVVILIPNRRSLATCSRPDMVLIHDFLCINNEAYSMLFKYHRRMIQHIPPDRDMAPSHKESFINWMPSTEAPERGVLDDVAHDLGWEVALVESLVMMKSQDNMVVIA